MTVRALDIPKISTISALIEQMNKETGTVAMKVNHGTWERLAMTGLGVNFPPLDDRETRLKLEARYAGTVADAHRCTGFFTSGFMDELLLGFKSIRTDDLAFHSGMSIDAFTNDDRFFPVQREPNALPTMEYWSPPKSRQDMDALLFKNMAEIGSYPELFEYLKDDWIVAVGPPYCRTFLDFARLPHGTYIEIHPQNSIPDRDGFEQKIIAEIEKGRKTGRKITFIHQASILGNLWTFRLRPKYPEVRWLDFGLSMSLCNPEEDIFGRLWGQLAGDNIAEHLNSWLGQQAYRPLPSNPKIDAYFTPHLVNLPKPHRARPEHWRPDHTTCDRAVVQDEGGAKARELIIAALRQQLRIPDAMSILPMEDLATAREAALSVQTQFKINPQIEITGVDELPEAWKPYTSLLENNSQNLVWLGPTDALTARMDKEVQQLASKGRPLIIEGPARVDRPWTDATWIIPLSQILEETTPLAVVVMDGEKSEQLPVSMRQAGIEDLVLALDWLNNSAFRCARLEKQRKRIIALARRIGLKPISPKSLIDSLAHAVPFTLGQPPKNWPKGDVAELFTLTETTRNKWILWVDTRPRASLHSTTEILAAMTAIAGL